MTRQIETLNRRQVIQQSTATLLSCGLGCGLAANAQTARADLVVSVLPDEPLDIGTTPQFVFDLYSVDCTWQLREKQDPMRRVFHQPQKHGDGPVFTGDQPSHFWVVKDPEDGKIRMWYQLNQRLYYEKAAPGQPSFRSYLAYAESSDGVHWERPELNLFKSDKEKVPPNCVLMRPEYPFSNFDAPMIVDVPEKDRRGLRYHMLYRCGVRGNRELSGIRLIGSHDGIHWDLDSDTQLSSIASDHHNNVHYDARRGEYIMLLRAKQIYIAPGQSKDRVDSGQSRRGVARMASKELWTKWTHEPQTIFMPDELDAAAGYNYVYGLPAVQRHGIYWGFMQSFRLNDYMHAQLAWSRDGIHFERLPERPKIVEYGADGTWDDTMLLASPAWIEMGDEWWVYYNGWDGSHGTPDRTGGIGLAKLRKEGFISQRGPTSGGVVCTRKLVWPGGPLIVNCDAGKGKLTVRVSDHLRKPIEGYNHTECETLKEDRVNHEVRWQGRSLEALRGKVIRLEFLLHDADLYAFRSGPVPA